MRSFLLTFLFIILVSNILAQKPNIVIIYTDDQSFNSIGYTSKGAVYTPTLDMLAENGMVFTNAHHPVTVCSPSRYSLLTGKFSGRCVGTEYLERYPPGTMTRTENSCELTRTELHLGNILKDNGYTTGFVGKSHIMEHDILSISNWPLYGLQIYAKDDDPYDPAIDAKMKHNHQVYQSIVRSYGFDYADAIYMANVKELRNDALNIHNLEWTVDKARKFIEQEKDNPFFLFFNTTLHHGPAPWGKKDGKYWSSFDADPKLTGEGVVDTTWDFMPDRQEIQDKYTAEGLPERDAYALWLDEGIKAIYDKVVELNLEENTLIIFMPDHGSYRHGKATLHDYGLKVPMLMHWKGTITTGSVYSGLVQTVDFLPTILEIAGITPPAELETDGISLKTIIESGSGEAHTSLFGELGYSRAVKTKDWKYIAVRYPEDVQDQIDRGEKFVGYQEEILDLPYLTRNSHLGHFAAKWNPNYFDLDQLYDLNADSAETVNVLDQHPEVVTQMRELLADYLQDFENRPFGEFTLTSSDPPMRANTPVPFSGATQVSNTGVLKWTSEYKATSHDISFGTTNPPPFVANQETVEFDPGTLKSDTKYYWRIDEKNANGITAGDLWSFTTQTNPLAGKAINPAPENFARSVRKNIQLEWEKADNAAYYKLYLGTGNPEFINDVTELHYDPEYLKSNTLYTWRVDAVNAEGEVTKGDVWVFFTGYGNIAPEADVTVSSTSDINSFDGNNVKDRVFLNANNGEWKSDGESTPWLELSWTEKAVVDRIHLYDRVGSSTQIVNGEIEFSDGSIIETGTLPADGTKKTLEFAPREMTSLKLTVTEGIGEIGLAEIEVYDTTMYEPTGVIDRDLGKFHVYPNPLTEKQINLTGLSDQGLNRIHIYNIAGELQDAYLIGASSANLDLSNLNQGMYFIQVDNYLYRHTMKLIIE